MTIAVAGELDIATAPRFSARLGELLRRGYPRELVLDLSGLTFIDATGLRALTELRLRVEQQQAVLVLEAVPAQMRRVLQLIGPARRFLIRN
jgi:anti-anti-sigma factor